jgi:hypothetical protein
MRFAATVNAVIRLCASGLCAVAAITVTATALLGQTRRISDLEKQRAAQLLVSPAWSDMAWGAYLAGRLHADDLNGQLLDQLRLATAVRDMPSYSEEHAFTAVLFDALIEGRVDVPAKLLEPFEQSWAAEVLILVSRTRDDEELLLRLGREESRDVVWLAANNLLFERKSQRWYESIWQEIGITHRFDVTDASDSSGYGDGGSAGGVCGDGVLAMPNGFPPVTICTLKDAAFAGNVVLAEGPRTVYYSRTIVPTDKQVGFGSCISQVNRETVRVAYLARLSVQSVDDTERLFHPKTLLRYANQEDFIRQIDQNMNAQENGLRGLIQAIENNGLHVPEIQLRIRPEVKDYRQTPSGALPQPQLKGIRLR